MSVIDTGSRVDRRCLEWNATLNARANTTSSNSAQHRRGAIPLPQLVRRETDDGLTVVRFLVEVMDSEVDGVKTTDRIAAARELLDRGFGKSFTAVDGSSDDSDDAADASAILTERILRVLHGAPTVRPTDQTIVRDSGVRAGPSSGEFPPDGLPR